MGDYWGHWLDVGRSLTRPPRIFRVNWFRTGADGKFLWPGFGDNLRVLKWIIERCEGRGDAVDTPIGYVPTPDALDRRGLDVPADVLGRLLHVDAAEWVEAVEGQEHYLHSFGGHLPPGIAEEHHALAQRIHDAVAPAGWSR
jgi:phosphoenolpyruvate carboxykinase (GTP)